TSFQDLLRLPRRRVSLSTFTLEEDAIVSPSPLLEDVDAVGLPVERLVAVPGAQPRLFQHDALMRNPAAPVAAAGAPAEWLSLRLARTFLAPRFRGIT